MSDYNRQLAELRQELDVLKTTLQCCTDPDEHIILHADMNANLRAYLALVDASLQAALLARRRHIPA